MKYIVFIIVFLNTFSNAFAWGYNNDCTDISISDIKFTQSNQIEVTVHGPQRVSDPDYLPCCLQQGPMIIGDYKFYTNNPRDPIATVWKGRQWVNGYSEDNSADPNDCLYYAPVDCDKYYEGAIDYTRTDIFDASRFPPPGGQVTLVMDIFAHCTFDTNFAGKTYCHQACEVNYSTVYNPQK
ncbi:unnamed protein product [Rhizophagus irregularis]|uniref:Secreted protein n=1 Tax=Rhizophagus irregularis TaxID=588596 RepID=A0A2I1G4V6_9GLOM|nr:hypothetical protein RhiirA4_416837 [Rhizophagus irregularis]CAB4407904.1 unnamed protein product [Rhizophagus irregularis]